MSSPAYPAAHAIAPILHEHFARHIAAARSAESEQALPAPPDIEAIEAIIDAAFWASLRREEGYVPKISLALVAPAQAAPSLMFERSLPLAATTLVRIAAAVERPGIHLGVWAEGDELRVWGAVRTVPTFCFVLEVAAPGLLVVKHHRGEAGKFVNVAVIEGDQIKVIDELQRAGAARSVDAGARPGRSTARRTVRQRRLARVNRAASDVRHFASLYGTGGARPTGRGRARETPMA
jgi:hypothetical protein